MIKDIWLAAACVLAGAAGAASASASDESKAVQDAIRENYAAYSSFDEKRYRATTTDDYVLLEHGELIDREGDVANMAKPDGGYRRTDMFDFHSVRVEGDVAYAVYTLRSEVFDNARGARSREWLESAILRRGDSGWKVALTHSTRVSHPGGSADMNDFAVRYTAAWCSQDPARVAAFYAQTGSLTINGGTPSIGRTAITDAAGSFMSDYPDMIVEMNGLDRVGDGYRYRWSFAGSNIGPGGTARKIRISGYEEWTIGTDGLIARSLGHYDQADWDRQLGKSE